MIEQELKMNSMFKDDASFAKLYNFREPKSDFFDCIISNLPVYRYFGIFEISDGIFRQIISGISVDTIDMWGD